MEVGVSRLFLSVEMFIHRRYNRRREIEVCKEAIMWTAITGIFGKH